MSFGSFHCSLLIMDHGLRVIRLHHSTYPPLTSPLLHSILTIWMRPTNNPLFTGSSLPTALLTLFHNSSSRLSRSYYRVFRKKAIVKNLLQLLHLLAHIRRLRIKEVHVHDRKHRLMPQTPIHILDPHYLGIRWKLDEEI